MSKSVRLSYVTYVPNNPSSISLRTSIPITLKLIKPVLAFKMTSLLSSKTF